ncbi:hypothetical protein [Aeromonas sp. SCS5]|uniref:hypothetical protein n=1 Tax=Aeromonas sp. SCS5 TaxID=1519205 RepID=UPI0009042AE5|nr:hypothetical protein [Aeromonas sp. SCS5]
MATLATEFKTRSDVMQYCIDPQFAVKTLDLPSALTVDLPAGSCIDPATGALLSGSTATAVAVVSDFVPKGSKAFCVFYKHVILLKSGLTAGNAAGLTKAISLLDADPYIEFSK